MSELEKKKTGYLSTTSHTDPFEEYANAIVARGKFLKFVKGDFFAGKENEEIPLGTKFVALMAQLTVGWIHWRDGMPDDKRMGLLTECYKPPLRSELGDTDKTSWESDNNGEEQDPTQYTNELPMRRVDTGEVYVFST